MCGIASDLLEYTDEGKCAISNPLNLSAAFDTVNQKLLIENLMYIGVEEDFLMVVYYVKGGSNVAKQAFLHLG